MSAATLVANKTAINLNDDREASSTAHHWVRMNYPETDDGAHFSRLNMAAAFDAGYEMAFAGAMRALAEKDAEIKALKERDEDTVVRIMDAINRNHMEKAA